ncbi:MurR/RpiR family transcriptional regulator [Mesorhizobium sp. 1M-11]|uniref:MurR/RpiR family transcriptional regulator n=1 Tax=Mesorhizobium sp. 1M-11 TaxID=1529006 RepID=UPI0009E84D58|nr:MurR/RpiR family transcriptional regulator [Mesorhizobium sp. 1M-11]
MSELLVERFETMPPQLQVAARFVLDHPQDVALMSMREQASQAGVSHSTMMRLARWLGLDGYEDMRSLYARALRDRGAGEAIRPGLPPQQEQDYPAAGIAADTLAAQVASLGEYGNAMQFLAAARLIADSKTIFGLGFGASRSVVGHFVQTVSPLLNEGRRTVFVADSCGTGAEALLDAKTGDVVLVVGAAPYERATIDFARQSASQGAAVLAITDSSVSPLARLARETIVVTSNSGSFFPSMVPAFAAVEILVALAAPLSDVDAVEKLKQSQEQLAAFGVYWKAAR